MDDLYKKINAVAVTSGVSIPQALADEIHFRCNDLDTPDIENNIKACLRYALDNGHDALANEEDDTKIWDYCD